MTKISNKDLINQIEGALGFDTIMPGNLLYKEQKIDGIRK